MEIQEGDAIATFERFDKYDFVADEEFQAGLADILSSNPRTSPDLILMAKIFYYTKTIEPIDFNDYTAWKTPTLRMSARDIDDALRTQDTTFASTPNAPTASSTTHLEVPTMTPEADADIPYPASFADIVELISSGKPVPGIKTIPDKIAEGEISVSKSEVRAKPWESDAEATEVSFFAVPGSQSESKQATTAK